MALFHSGLGGYLCGDTDAWNWGQWVRHLEFIVMHSRRWTEDCLTEGFAEDFGDGEREDEVFRVPHLDLRMA